MGHHPSCLPSRMRLLLNGRGASSVKGPYNQGRKGWVDARSLHNLGVYKKVILHVDMYMQQKTGDIFSLSFGLLNQVKNPETKTLGSASSQLVATKAWQQRQSAQHRFSGTAVCTRRVTAGWERALSHPFPRQSTFI